MAPKDDALQGYLPGQLEHVFSSVGRKTLNLMVMCSSTSMDAVLREREYILQKTRRMLLMTAQTLSSLLQLNLETFPFHRT